MARFMPFVLVGGLIATAGVPAGAAEKPEKAPRALAFAMKSLGGKDVDLGKYQGKVVKLIEEELAKK
jgi:hypothetical protein